MKIAANSIVKLVYRLTDDKGGLLEERTPEDPLIYLHGCGQLLRGIEQAIESQSSGFHTVVNLEAKDAYGEFDPSLVAEMNRDQFPESVKLQPGMGFETVGPNGEKLIVRVTEVQEDYVLVDGNHPLAGLNLIFDVRVLGVREATDQEVLAGKPLDKKIRSHLH